ncbi:SRPBCC family protein [Yoonia litorea]|uniref:Polyketide cyclase / dehydrase and lipid transport n=1 Tax=Yoonia litorea TaxID=1123755 RepID=A0A1I6LBS3_9RHOB|nr:SRPBCC family protein [Yoonia litorea]SFS00923.1 Polyketide cyclase / dehydrase and lipid transport [Yoonia litorea]
MKFTTREDIEAPINAVFERVSDFATYEKRAMRQGADVTRRSGDPVNVGTIWDVKFDFRGRPRALEAEIIRLDDPTNLMIESRSEGLDAVTEIDLVALSQTRTRVMVSIDVKAKTLTARLLLQSLKLAKAKLTKRFKGRVRTMAEDIEDEYRRSVPR